jgi:hypothetical protein
VASATTRTTKPSSVQVNPDWTREVMEVPELRDPLAEAAHELALHGRLRGAPPRAAQAMAHAPGDRPGEFRALRLRRRHSRRALAAWKTTTTASTALNAAARREPRAQDEASCGLRSGQGAGASCVAASLKASAPSRSRASGGAPCTGPDARGTQRPMHATRLIDPRLLEREDVLHGDDVPFHADDLG